MHPGLFQGLFLSASLEERQKLAETDDVHQFMSNDIEQQGEQGEMRAGFKGLEDIVILETDPVKIEPSRLQRGVLGAALVFGHQGVSMGGYLLPAQTLQGENVVAGPAPVGRAQLEKVGGHLFSDYRRLFQELFMLRMKTALAHATNFPNVLI